MNNVKINGLVKAVTILTASLIFIGCSPKKPPVDTPPLTNRTDSALPDFTNVSNNVDNALVLSEKIKRDAELIAKEIGLQDAKIKELVADLELLKAKANNGVKVDGKDVMDIIQKLKVLEERNKSLVTQNTELSVKIEQQAQVLKKTKEDAQKTFKKLIEKEKEANELRKQAEFFRDSLKNKNEEAEDLKKLLEKEKVKSGKAGVYRNWILGLAGAFILWIIIKNVLMVYFPTTRFRI